MDYASVSFIANSIIQEVGCPSYWVKLGDLNISEFRKRSLELGSIRACNASVDMSY
jgi:hypothetical protein